MTFQENKYDDNNVYAKSVEENIIHVSEAESGRRGYFCLGCDNELEAVKSKVQNRISYFRHVPLNVKIERKCIYSDETHRHKIAKRLLLELKYIKVPPVYKYAPRGSDGLGMFIKESEILHAASALPEQTFYEDESGNIKWGSNPEVDERYLLIKPDVTFFNAKGEPILFIELEATNKISPEKKAKLNKLGINTVRVHVPKDSPASIEASFNNTNRTLWVYNYDEERTEYVYVPAENSEGLSQNDEQQRLLFEESVKCRSAEIRSLIRSIERCLESKSYFTIERNLREELSRVEGNTEEHQAKLEELRREYEAGALNSIEPQIQEFNTKYKQFKQEEREFEIESADLERRYYKKIGSIGSEQASIDRITEGEIQDSNGGESYFERSRSQINRLTEELRLEIRREELQIKSIEREEAGLPERYNQLRESIINGFESYQEYESGEMENLEREQAELPEKFEREENNLPIEYGIKEEELRREFEAARELLDKIAEAKDGQGNTQLHFRIRGLLDEFEQFNHIKQAQINLKRNRTAWECFKKGAPENWDECRKLYGING